MAYAKKTWLQRIVSLPGRRRLTSTGTEDVYDMSRAEGEIIQEGDAWSAANMNDMEDRIESGLEEKLDVTKVVEDLNVTEEGYALGAKTASNKFSEISSALTSTRQSVTSSYFSGTVVAYKNKSSKAIRIPQQLNTTLTAGTPYTLFTLPVGYRPEIDALAKTIFVDGALNYKATINITQEGVVSVTPLSVNIPSGTWFSVYEVFV